MVCGSMFFGGLYSNINQCTSTCLSNSIVNLVIRESYLSARVSCAGSRSTHDYDVINVATPSRIVSATTRWDLLIRDHWVYRLPCKNASAVILSSFDHLYEVIFFPSDYRSHLPPTTNVFAICAEFVLRWKPCHRRFRSLV